MKREAHQIIYSPTDLVKFVQSPYVSWMDRFYLENPDAVTPDAEDPLLQVLARRGDEHENAHLQELRRQGQDVRVIERKSPARFEETVAALVARAPVVFQACLRGDDFEGFADFLKWKERDGEGGGYAVWDTKLSRHPKPTYIIQLCCYADMLRSMTGALPARMGVVLGSGEHVEYRVLDFFAYYRRVLDAFRQTMAQWNPAKPPEPDSSADHGRWQSHADRWLLERDHPSRVANIGKSQIVKLSRVGIATTTALARDCPARVPGIGEDVLSRLRRQAQLQVDSAGLARPQWELLPTSPDRPGTGLSALPPPSEQDVYFDMEGYPARHDWLEYLFGAAVREGKFVAFHDWWAHDEVQEKQAFESFLDWTYARWQRDPAMHVYHYAAYETNALRRLMCKYGTRENEVDALLRAGVFIDLHAIVRRGLMVGEPSYSLKNLEHLYMRREAEVVTAASSVVYYDAWCEADEPQRWQESPRLKAIRDYNEEDCVSTLRLADWLRARQAETGIDYVRPPESPEDEVKARQVNEQVQQRLDLADRLLRTLPAERSETNERADEHRITELLAWLLDFHRRCEKPMWWRLFERQDMSVGELWDDMDCLAGLERVGEPRKVKQSLEFDYRFDPNQDTKLSAGDRVKFSPDIGCSAELSAFDPEGRLSLKLGSATLRKCELEALPQSTSIVPYERVGADVIADSIFRVCANYADTEILPPCLDDFLHRRPPQVGQPLGVALVMPGEDDVAAGVRLAQAMQGTCLCIQGPPGTGKTYTSARIIKHLLEAGHSVGITSNSHNAIVNLMREVCEAGYRGQGIKVGGEDDETLFTDFPNVGYVKTSGELAEGRLNCLLGGTAWLFSREDRAGTLDYLFVDEAGQVSLANLVGMAPSTRNIVLMGDQMQLGQPIQGTHPGESGQSILEYYLAGHATIPPQQGLFLGTTWRLHPDICGFISEAVYEGRLKPHPETVNRVIRRGTGAAEPQLPESGIVFVPVQHVGNTQGSDEEVERIKTVVADLLGRRRTNRQGKDAGAVDIRDGLIFVTPYNMQVRKLKKALSEGARVASVDKFQGQQASIVIVSMCCSPGEYGARGLSFVLDINRMNVAISRAQSLAIIVGDPRIAESPAGSIDEMRRLNLYCWLQDQSADFHAGE
jgi:uncharacterized protein